MTCAFDGFGSAVESRRVVLLRLVYKENIVQGHKLTNGVLSVWILCAGLVAAAASAQGRQSENHELHAVPPPGAVVVDGKLDDWDLSGQIESFTEYRTRGTYSAELAAMYDKDFFYLAVVWRDPTPMVNMIDPDADGSGWQSECAQLRMITDLPVHVDCWFSTATKRPVIKILYGSVNKGAANMETFAAAPDAIVAGAKEAFLTGADGKQLATGPWLEPAQPGSPGTPDAHGQFFSTSFLWMDLNDDGKPQVSRESKTYLPKSWTEPDDDGKLQGNEILAGSRYATSEYWRYPLGVPLPFGGYWLDEGFNLYSCGVEAGYHYRGGMGPVVARIPFKEWTPGGAPVWDVKDQQLLTGQMRISSAYVGLNGPCQWKAFEVHLPNGQSLFSNGQCNWFPGERLYLPAEGKVVVGPPITCIRDDGTILWTYRDDWSGPLRAYWDKTLISADRDDLLVGTVGCLGRAKTKLGTVFAIQSSVGRVYFMTVNGLLIGSAFRDYRLGEPWPSDPQRGMTLGGTTMGGDWAGGHFFKSEKSNEFYLIAGGAQMVYHVIKLNGLDSIAAIPGGEVTVTQKELHPDAPAIAKKAVAPTTDGKLEKKALALDLDKAAVKDATLTPVKDAGGTLLKIAITGKQQDWAGVEIPALGGKWDLSKYRFVVAQVRNLGADPVKVNLRLDNPNAADDGKGGLANAVADGLNVDPRSGWTWTKVGIRRPADAVKLKLFGIAEYPWGRPYEKARGGAETETNDSWWFHAYPWGRPVDTANGSGIDPANVAKLVISVANPKEDCTLEIRSICAAGAAPSAELLGNPARFFPCIDEFGQYIHADWPGKTQRDAGCGEGARGPGGLSCQGPRYVLSDH